MEKEFEEKVEKIKKKTAFDEFVIGCCLCNFDNKLVCQRFRSSGCSELIKCIRIKNIERDLK